MRFPRDWGRHDQGQGVLVRMNFQPMGTGSRNSYKMCSMVEIAAEEYESVRSVDPSACEGYMIPIVGSKSAAQLLDPRRAEAESFAFLSSHPSGRATLHRLADHLEREFAFSAGILATLRLRRAQAEAEAEAATLSCALLSLAQRAVCVPLSRARSQAPLTPLRPEESRSRALESGWMRAAAAGCATVRASMMNQSVGNTVF